MTVDDIALMEFGFAESSSGMVFYTRLPGRNIHLTYFERAGVMNCHLKDTDRRPEKVWETTIGIQELANKLMRSLKRSIRRYNWNETYLMFQQPMIELIGQFSDFDKGDGRQTFNLLDTLRVFSSVKADDDLLTRARIRKGFALGNRPGFQYSLSQSYVVFPLDMHMCFQMNADFKRSILGKTPFGQGILRYMRYLEAELTDTDIEACFDRDTITKAKAAMETALLESTTGITPARHN